MLWVPCAVTCELCHEFVRVRAKDKAPAMARFDVHTGEAVMVHGGEQLRTKVFRQKDPQKDLGSAVIATFAGGMSAQVRCCYWGMIASMSEPPKHDLDALTRPTKPRKAPRPKTVAKKRMSKRALQQAQDVEARNAEQGFTQECISTCVAAPA